MGAAPVKPHARLSRAVGYEQVQQIWHGDVWPVLSY